MPHQHADCAEDFAKALKRASLERQLKGLEPNTLQDILEEAIEPWLEVQRLHLMIHSVGSGEGACTSASGNSCCRLASFR